MASAHEDYTDFDYRRADAGRNPRQGLAGIAQNRLFGLVEDGRGELVKSLDSLVQLVEDLAGRVGEHGSNPVASYAHQAVGAISDIRDGLRDKPVEALIEDGRQLVRRQPEVAVGVAVAVGFLTARLLKAGQ